ncbi:MAG: hypothetical protein Barrevirus3_33 [Barrevirus sp.]|uniref:Uncharacterized protein n=1 Tax=Barrevirus sp. TaxID=2487763 RepID=A0A3G4ZTI1_9VIRU|nr:MAG: hypothetical protein Barrevirus3_33 [Barrevirus sp.]
MNYICVCPRFHVSYHTKFPSSDTEIWLSKDKEIMPLTTIIDALITFGKIKKKRIEKEEEEEEEEEKPIKIENEIQYEDLFHEVPAEQQAETIKLTGTLGEEEKEEKEEKEKIETVKPSKPVTSMEITAEDIGIVSPVTTVTTMEKEEIVTKVRPVISYEPEKQVSVEEPVGPIPSEVTKVEPVEPLNAKPITSVDLTAEDIGLSIVPSPKPPRILTTMEEEKIETTKVKPVASMDLTEEEMDILSQPVPGEHKIKLEEAKPVQVIGPSQPITAEEMAYPGEEEQPIPGEHKIELEEAKPIQVIGPTEAITAEEMAYPVEPPPPPSKPVASMDITDEEMDILLQPIPGEHKIELEEAKPVQVIGPSQPITAEEMAYPGEEEERPIPGETKIKLEEAKPVQIIGPSQPITAEEMAYPGEEEEKPIPGEHKIELEEAKPVQVIGPSQPITAEELAYPGEEEEKPIPGETKIELEEAKPVQVIKPEETVIGPSEPITAEEMGYPEPISIEPAKPIPQPSTIVSPPPPPPPSIAEPIPFSVEDLMFPEPQKATMLKPPEIPEQTLISAESKTKIRPELLPEQVRIEAEAEKVRPQLPEILEQVPIEAEANYIDIQIILNIYNEIMARLFAIYNSIFIKLGDCIPNSTLNYNLLTMPRTLFPNKEPFLTIINEIISRLKQNIERVITIIKDSYDKLEIIYQSEC